MDFNKITEQKSQYDNLEKRSINELLYKINLEDHKVAIAVKKVIPEIEQLVKEIAKKMKLGGRLFYVGASLLPQKVFIFMKMEFLKLIIS